MFRVLILLVAVLLAGQTARGSEPFTILKSPQLKAMIDRKEPGLVVVDSRDPLPYREAHIKGARNIPWTALERNPALLDVPRDAVLVFYCSGAG